MPPENKSTRPLRIAGSLSHYLAEQRANLANRLISTELRSGRILDIGCGWNPFFIAQTPFAEKFAIDRVTPALDLQGVQWINRDIEVTPQLPFEDNYFSAVTMLAVIEHLDPAPVQILLQEVYRVLKSGGVFIMTTPSAWSDGLLHWLARARIVSEDGIHSHVCVYSMALLGWQCGQAGFAMDRVRFGYFEAFLNMWAMATK
ncbi:MAG: class I SAM-dependent methyltransferase [Chloroflexota bacterium]